MEQPIKFWLKIKYPNGSIEHEHPGTQESFSIRLGQLRRKKINVVPFVGLPDKTKKSGICWLKYSKYKKLKKEGISGNG